jgi:hypothetical protein
MKRITTVLLLIVLVSGCKKTIEKAQEDLIVSAMTDGQWVITSFINDGTDITPDFSSYKFQYYSNRTVDAIKNGAIDKTGSWDGNASAMTINANFSAAINPLLLINGTWHIDANSWTYVKASQNTAGGIRSLRLDKL